MADPTRFTQEALLLTAARAVGKVDATGERGITMLSIDEIAAMAGVLALFGLRPIPPGATEIPDPLIINPRTS